jgi:asparagine synthase (glutamine-hydrolysing)
MCGIAGRINFDGRPIAPSDILAMIRPLAHRGPDDQGIWVEGTAGLGHRRLSVIDLSQRGHQPMSNEEGTIWIVFNGEIYNFAELREELVGLGYRFRSKTDTEVLLYLYQQFGLDFLTRLRGMFAFAIWDASRRRLVLARDPLGKKPLYFQKDDRAFRFGSEPSAILADRTVRRDVDPAALHRYFTLGFVPHPFSAFSELSKLAPASWMTVDETGDVRTGSYWLPRFEPKLHDAPDELALQLRTVLGTAVRRRLIGDVPIGILLSGGLDSSAVVAAAREMATGRLKTFSVGFDDAAYDELRYARQVATQFETEHEEVVIDSDVADVLPRIAMTYGEPFADSSAVPSFKICQIARRSVTIALNGDGGDEAFGGYDRYRAVVDAARLQRLPLSLRRSVSRLARFGGGHAKSNVARAQRFVRGAALEAGARYAFWMSVFNLEERRAIYTPEFAEQVRNTDSQAAFDEAFARSDPEHPFDKANRLDLELYLPGDLLVKMDLASMAHSLEARSPFLDQDVVDFGVSLPVPYKFRGRAGKWLLRRAFQSDLPPDILKRRKMGFAVPLEKWFRGPLRAIASDVLLDGTAERRGIVRRDYVSRMIDDHVSGRRLHHARLWSLLMLELWFRSHVDDTADVRGAAASSR